MNAIKNAGKARKLEADFQAKQSAAEKDRGPGYGVSMGWGFIPDPTGMLGGWAPGLLPKKLPDGVGQKLPKGADLCVQFHFHRTGKVETDRTAYVWAFPGSPIRLAKEEKGKTLEPIPLAPLSINP